ncbi:tyrosine-type recombinase/integrase [Lactiplantibacillus daowaiensis]|uniref:Tyrosine-type recombinase/integrase n=1 Tax=Lactiplantibacillus daowaiensis TaxID=2559918 RepID=A0ABW1RXX7_9LACO|nr:site-specific integrase [Lactiplantibacillus daowaiensis]
MRGWKALKKHPGLFEYETKKGKKYGIRRGYTNADHKTVYWSKSGFTNWREADISLKQFEAKLSAGELTESLTGDVTLESYYQKIKKRNVELGKWRPNTVLQKEAYWKNHLSPIFGKKRLSDITRQSYQHFIDGLIKKGYAKNTIVTTNSLMQIIMNDAELNDVIPKNKLRSISIDGGAQPADVSLNEKDFDTIMKKAKEIFSPYKYGMILLLTLGERREELVGLRYSSFKFDKWNGEDICAITFSTGRTRGEINGGALKNESSYRTIYVRGEMEKLCRYMITASKNICARVNRHITEDSFLLVNDKTGMPVYPAYPNKLLEKVQKETGIHVHPHVFRHYFATMAMTSGQVETDVMHWLGHSSLKMTQSYTRENVRGALNVFDGMQPTLLVDNKIDKNA